MKESWFKNMTFLILIILFLSQCTPYQAAGFTGGYSETRLDENVWKVSFKGNGYTSIERASDLCLLRSSELCLRNGYSYFITVEANDYVSQHQYTTPTQTTTTGSARVLGSNIFGSSTTRTTGGNTHTISKPRTAYTIVCYREKPDTFAYNAIYLQKSLKIKYEIEDSPQSGIYTKINN